MRRRNRHKEKISDIDFEDPSPFGEQSESNAPQAATGEIEFSALPEAQDAEGAKRRPAREDRRIVRPALARKRVKASFGSFAIDVERTDLADALAALLQAAPNAAADLADSPEDIVRETLAGFEDLDEEVVERLALDESDAVRKALLENEDVAARLDAEKLAALQESLR